MRICLVQRSHVSAGHLTRATGLFLSVQRLLMPPTTEGCQYRRRNRRLVPIECGELHFT